jgi:hypothetical protein
MSLTTLSTIEKAGDLSRVDQFVRLREVIEERAPRKFFEEQAQADRPVVLRANDFVR